MVEELASLVSWHGQGKTDVRWSDIEHRLNLRLPNDYKMYVERFPVGQFQTYLRIIHPGASPDDSDVFVAMKNIIAEFELDIEEGLAPRFPYLFHPHTGGLLPWGYVGFDWVMTWATSPTLLPNNWPTVIISSDLDEWFEFNGPMTRCISAIVTGDDRLEALRYISERPPIFHAFS